MRGRPREGGKIYYLGRLRLRAGDPPELAAFLERLETAGAGRGELLRAALVGGMGSVGAGEQGSKGEDGETRELLERMLGGF